MGRDRNLLERVFNFVIRVLEVIEKLRKNRRNTIISDQLTHSTTSTGANLEEADGAISRKEFVKFVNIAKREMKESDYWLRILQVFEKDFTIDIEPLLPKHTYLNQQSDFVNQS